jgi:lysozyme
MARDNFKNARDHKTHAAKLRLLLAKGWKQLGIFYISPYSGCRFDERGALDVEILRGAFETRLGRCHSMSRQINARGLSLVKHFEQLFLKAYRDEVGIWTIGWGHTGLQHKDGTVYEGRFITREKAEELLRYDMHQFETRVETFVRVPIDDDQFSALVSFDFNTGGLESSTLLKLLNAGDDAGAADQFLRWNKAGGKELKGLTRRRISERNLFLGKNPYVVDLDLKTPIFL